MLLETLYVIKKNIWTVYKNMYIFSNMRSILTQTHAKIVQIVHIFIRYNERPFSEFYVSRRWQLLFYWIYSWPPLIALVNKYPHKILKTNFLFISPKFLEFSSSMSTDSRPNVKDRRCSVFNFNLWDKCSLNYCVINIRTIYLT